MKILYIIPYLGIGGTEKHLLDLITGFEQEHDLFLMAPPGETLEQFTALRVKHFPFSRLDQNPFRGVREFFKSLRKILRENPIDLIHIHGAPELMLPVRMVTKAHPLVFTVHGFAGPRKDWDYWGCAKSCNNFATQVITVAKVEEDLLIEKGLKPEIIQTIHNGVPDPWKLSVKTPEIVQDLPAEKQIIGVIARLEPVKGINFLLDAVARLEQKFPQLHLIIVGAGSKEQELKKQAEELQISDKVTFAGYQKNIHDYLHSYEIFVIPSLHEAHPLVLMEGMGQGKAIVATKVGGIPEVITDGINGLLVPPLDSTALAQAISRLLGEPALRKVLGTNARETYEREFTVERMLDETMKVYEKVLGKK